MSSTVLNRGRRLQTMCLGAFIGANAALPMYLWQSNTQMAVAIFIIAGYTSWMVAATWQEIVDNYTVRQELHTLPVNRIGRRLVRMIADAGFWWSIIFGGATVTGAVWYAGFQQMTVLIATGVLWSLIAVLLNYGLTLVQPTSCCRKCGYQLISQMDPSNPDEVVRCPECGTRWSKEQLFLVKPVTPSTRDAA